jgi:UDPglucose--hexose-1-phosphate uridylyltransferase
MDLTSQPHRRFNPLLDEWVLVSPHRAKRPWQGQQEKDEAEARPAYDPTCYLCAGNTRTSGITNPKGAGGAPRPKQATAASSAFRRATT